MKLYTAGYEHHTLDSFVRHLRENQVEVIADVRLVPLSADHGFDRPALREAAAAYGIRYIHLRDLGGAPSGTIDHADSQTQIRIYRAYMSSRWDESLAHLVDLLLVARVCLVCAEADPTFCHRSTIAAELHHRHPTATVEHL